ncbi:hypothetical protein NVS55_31990 [Myxococcus stipitatus]|uniref:hypothetical protein n=1 Tax=Myxococcus stipitatus TaxID=83455 RepID=UPI003145019F
MAARGASVPGPGNDEDGAGWIDPTRGVSLGRIRSARMRHSLRESVIVSIHATRGLAAMPKRITNVVILKGGKANIFRYGHDGRPALELLVGGPGYIDSKILETRGWRASETLEDVRSSACVDYDRKELVLGGDFGFIRTDLERVFVTEWDICPMLLPYWPGWTLSHTAGHAMELAFTHAQKHGLELPSTRPLVEELRHPVSEDLLGSVDEMTFRYPWKEEYNLTPPPARLSEDCRDALLIRIKSLRLSEMEVSRCSRAGLLFVGDVVGATAAELDASKMDLSTRNRLFGYFRNELKLNVPTTLPVFLDNAIQQAHGWELPVELPLEWKDWRRQALG